MNAPPPRRIAWWKGDPFGAEFVEVDLRRDEIAARGVALGSAPLPYRLDYELESVSGFVTARFVVTARGDGWERTLDLRRTPAGTWKETWAEEGAPGVPLPRRPTDVGSLAGALDVDLELSPLFNTMPALRHGLVRKSGSVDLVMAWVTVPDLAVHRSPQRYSFVRLIDEEQSLVRFESLAGDGFAADITYEASGLVLNYPGIGTRMH